MEDLLKEFEPKHDLLVCIDSDGTVFDNMELKHKECFCPAAVNVWKLQAVSRYFREVWDFVNLYSRDRGINRFPGIVKALEETMKRPEVQERNITLPDLSVLKKWIAETPVLGCGALEKFAQTVDDEAVRTAIAWSHEVDENVHRIVHDLPPLPYVRETLEKMNAYADIVIVSAATHDALEREWISNDLIRYVTVAAGQELGSKAECIRRSMEGKYSPDHVLMLGDAPGDEQSAAVNHVLYYPIIPGQESASWKKLLHESFDKFTAGTYKDAYMDGLVSAFYDALAVKAPWEE